MKRTLKRKHKRCFADESEPQVEIPSMVRTKSQLKNTISKIPAVIRGTGCTAFEISRKRENVGDTSASRRLEGLVQGLPKNTKNNALANTLPFSFSKGRALRWNSCHGCAAESCAVWEEEKTREERRQMDGLQSGVEVFVLRVPLFDNLAKGPE